jgi:hypothetical protein
MTLSNEIWNPILGYENLYEISNFGNINGLKFKTRKKIASLDKDGYKVITLWKNNKTTYYRVHRLVAQAFIPNPNNYFHINHKDEIKSNNNIDNLEWCTVKYNNVYGNRLYKIKKPIIQYSLDNVFIKKWDSVSEAGTKYGCNTNIINTCRGSRNKAYGFIWRYENEID